MIITTLDFVTDELKQHFTDSKSKWIVVHPLCLPGVQAAIKDLDEIKVSLTIPYIYVIVMISEMIKPIVYISYM